MKRKIFALIIVLIILTGTVSADTIGNGQGVIVVPAYFDMSLYRPDREIVINSTEFLWTSGSVTFSFDVLTCGYYLLEMEYVLLPDTHGRIELEVTTDCGTSYTAGLWRYRRGGGIFIDAWGDELPPLTADYNRRLTRFLKDGGQPVYIYLGMGRRTITMTGDNADIVVSEIIFRNYYNPCVYANMKPDEQAILSTPPLEHDNEIGTRTILIQGEKPAFMTGADIRITGDHVSHNVSPVSSSRRLYNTIGGSGTWSEPGQAVSWEFLIMFDGYYRFSVKARQNVNPGASSYRRVLINGELPVREWNAVEFGYNKGGWYRRDFTDRDNNDIYIFLQAGRHVITLEAVSADNQAPSPLEIDYIEIVTVHENFTPVDNSIPRQLLFSFGGLVNSYFRSYVSVSYSSAPVDVWVSADRETAVLVREFVEREYNRDNIYISITSGSVLEAALNRAAPCVALFVSDDEIVQLLSRGFVAADNNNAVLLRNNSDFYAEQEAREFLMWWSSEETQSGFERVLLAARGGTGFAP